MSASLGPTVGNLNPLLQSNKANGKSTLTNKSRQQTNYRETANMVGRNINLGSLITNPEALGFQKLQHRRREPPRFLIGQQPQLKQRPFVQDPWDKANQAKMLQLENSISDMNELYETLKKMRDMERKVMESKGLVDKADYAKDLNEAIIFQGTCQDMCPIFERSRRNVESSLFSYEKEKQSDKKASRAKALKVFARPAAAAAPPLPSDVRPPHVLVKTLDYIVDNLLTSLPEGERFLWDRMRSIRQDFTYQNYSGPECVDCNERIVRIHLLILHVMVKSKAEFSLQQELEQLHKSLITLSEIYDDVRANGGECPNEAEFRAYSLLSKIRDPQYDRTVLSLPPNILQNDLVQLALCFRRIISNSNYIERGYVRTENSLNFYERFFSLLQSKEVPFLMSSFLETYLGEIRFYAVKALSHSLNKKHKPIPLDNLQSRLLFNTQEELVEFCDYYSILIVDNGADLKSLIHHSHKLPETQPLSQSYLQSVEDKLQATTYSNLINSGKPNFDSIPDVQMATPNVIPLPKKLTEIPKSLPTVPIPINNGPISTLPEKVPLQGSKISTSFGLTNNKLSNTLVSLPQTSKKEVFSAPAFNLAPSFNKDESKITNELNEQKPEVAKQQVGISEAQRDDEIRKLKRKEEIDRAVGDIYESLIRGVVKEHVKRAAESCLNEQKIRAGLIDNLAENLYDAFIHENLYTVYLDSKAEVAHNRTITRNAFNKWYKKYQALLKQKEVDTQRRMQLENVERQLGVPSVKKIRRLLDTPNSDTNSSFFSSERKRRNIFSPVSNEINTFSKQLNKKSELWRPLDIKELYYDKLSTKVPRNLKSVADVLIYSKNWTSVANTWIKSKFNLQESNIPIEYKNDYLRMQVKCVSDDYHNFDFSNVQLLVFNTGVTDSDIFDLEMKIQQDGEELIKLMTEISLNTNICFNLLIVYWESSETSLDHNAIFKYLKINRIVKSLSGILDNIGFVNISSSSPHKSLEEGLKKMSSTFTYKLTERGKDQLNKNSKRSLAGIYAKNDNLKSSEFIDEKMRKMLELEKQKLNKELNEKNMYAHLRSHVTASPKLRKRKLPVLLSETKTSSKFKTPLMSKFSTSSSPPLPSHLVTKVRRTGRIPSYNGHLAPGTPSYSRNVPVSYGMSQQTPVATLDSTRYFSGNLSNLTFNQSVQDSALFRTPSQAIVGSDDSKISNAPNELKEIGELKSLIESVRRKVRKDSI
ncbi:hypothetical protein KAFR_0B05840 [Kazachstania africana CBS 2517]|uniref:Nuclear mRNA export factor n=1 Tax=Kazachstania africana (strain ATCC 22294 / BCRC 22015 / CBS 2517 / CECT 1963 / NBRC 1671 / NRRL Y-8276) TaxID=1071382 RepID=H2AR80_KAZAF|nr:hypothetical protein KAFR_0B05840 [Kazachstania africana CBS 2517]CCF56880.1 hypothetical protein KAFR_0B05840 [Kazachstania africana CBS 2517]